MSKALMNWVQRYLGSAEAISIVFLLVGGVAVLHTMGNVVAPLLVSIIIAYMLAAAVSWLERLRFPRLLAVTLVFLLFLGAVLLLLLWVLPLLWNEVSNLFAAIPGMFRRGQVFIAELQDRYPVARTLISTERFEEMASSWGTYFAGIGKLVWTFSLISLNSSITAIVYIVLVPLLVFFFLKDGKIICAWFASFLPQRRATLQLLWDEASSKVGSYIKGKVTEMLLVFVAAFLIFAFMGLPYSLLLGVLVGLSVFVPYIGIVIVTIPVVVVGLVEWGWTAQFLYLMIAYAALVTIDANILVPMLFAGAMNLHPVAIIVAVLIFGSLGGFWGIFFAIPLVAFADTLIKYWPQIEA
jgi:putative permease